MAIKLRSDQEQKHGLGEACTSIDASQGNGASLRTILSRESHLTDDVQRLRSR